MSILLFLLLINSCLSMLYTEEQKNKYRRYFERQNQAWIGAHQNVATNYDTPVFWGIDKDHYFSRVSLSGWASGVVLTPWNWVPFRKDVAKKMCLRATIELARDPSLQAYDLMTSSIGNNPNLSAFYASRFENYLYFGSIGDWWAALYRQGKQIQATKQAREAVWNIPQLPFEFSWQVERNDILVFTTSDFGYEHAQIIDLAAEAAETQRMPLSQIPSNLRHELSIAEIEGRHGILVVIRMVNSRQASIL
ncbi:hypothetical protein OXX69_010323 [Metschnikowia pulcherrima]